MLLNLPLNKELQDLLLLCNQEEIEQAYRLLRAEFGPDVWLPMLYRNSQSGKFYKPHHEKEAEFVFNDGPWRNGLIKGGEGSGKSVAGVIKDLERLRRSMNGILASPDLVHFKKSLWPEFKRWCPWEQVVPDQQRRGKADWEPHDPFTLTFKNGAQVVCGGMDEPANWEGSNISWAHLDEARRKKDASALKVMAGRIRIKGPNEEEPQMWFTSTPKKNWLYEYFGPWDRPGEVDPRAEFKAKSLVVKLKTEDNERAGNLSAGYTEERASSLNEAERRVLLDAEWEDIDDVDHFLPSIILWDNCREDLPPVTRHNAVVLAADAGVSNDCFALVGVTNHPDRARGNDAMVCFTKVWVPRPGLPLDFDRIENEILATCKMLNVYELVYDPYQLHQMMTSLNNRGIVQTKAFGQQTDRARADKRLQDAIIHRKIAHDGSHTELRQHLDNADKKIASEERSIRLVKREPTMKIDLAVALSMALDSLSNSSIGYMDENIRDLLINYKGY
jgi:hypothetical protein